MPSLNPPFMSQSVLFFFRHCDAEPKSPLTLLRMLRKASPHALGVSKITSMGLQYARCQLIGGVDTFATLQSYRSFGQAVKQWRMLQLFHPNQVMQSMRIEENNDKTCVLIYPTFFIRFSSFLKHYNYGVKDGDLWQVLRSLGLLLQYMRSQKIWLGNLRDGICVSTHLQVSLFKIVSGNRLSNFSYIEALVIQLIGRVKDPSLLTRLQRYHTFISTHKRGRGLMSEEEHSLFLIRHPLFWDSEMGLKFYANMFRLCKDQTNGLLSLRRKMYLPQVFTKALDQLYGNWTTKVQQSVIMNEVCKKGHMVHRRGKRSQGKKNQGNNPSTQLVHNSQGSKSQSKKKGKKNVGKKSQSQQVMGQQQVMGNQNVRVPGIGSLDYMDGSYILLFAHNLHKHDWERAEELNMTTAKAKLEEEKIPKEVHQEFLRVFEEADDDAYEALYIAYKAGYRHPQHTLSEILEGRIGC